MGNKIKMLKPDAVITIKVGTAFIKRIQNALLDVSAGKTEEDLANLHSLIENKEELTEPWMNTVFTLSLLVKSIEEEGISQGFVYEEDVDKIS
jgi:hypothetical protein